MFLALRSLVQQSRGSLPVQESKSVSLRRKHSSLRLPAFSFYHSILVRNQDWIIENIEKYSNLSKYFQKLSSDFSSLLKLSEK